LGCVFHIYKKSYNTILFCFIRVSFIFYHLRICSNEYVVSPEQSDDGVGDSGAALARDIITHHAATIATAVTSNPAATTSQPPNSQQQQQVMYAPVAAPPLLVAPPALPQIAAQGMAVPRTITQYSAQHAMSPAPVISAPIARTTTTKAPTRTVQKKAGGAADAKRRRTNPPEVAAQGLINTSYLTNPANMSPAVVAAAAAAAAMQGRGRKKTQAQIDRRRERNRILARRTRLRKKFFFESLQKEVMELQRENSALRDIVRTEVETEEGRELLEQCKAARQLPREVLEACGENPDLDQQDFNLITSIQQSQHSFVITDPSLQDNPIVFASDDFLTLTGYSREDVLGRNCRFLQGEETSKDKLDAIRKGLATGEDVSVTLVNYTADGTPFWNKLFIAALRDAQNNIVNFIAVIVKVASPEPGDPDYGKSIGEEEEEENEETSVDLKEDADGCVKVIESAVDAAVAAAPSVLS
jgi:PAS domain S-box-containing protein